MKLSVFACSDPGKYRKINQDNFFIISEKINMILDKRISVTCRKSQGIFAVADGMGGYSDGEYSSSVAIQSMQKHIDSGGNFKTKTSVEKYIDLANMLICERIKETNKRTGSTICILSIENNVASVYNIGDSSCFLFRNGKLTKISRDHTVVAQLIDMNLLTKEQARKDKRLHQLSQHLGIFPEEMNISVYEAPKIEIQENDVFLLCSDGVTDVLDNEELSKQITQDLSSNIAQKIVDKAIEENSKDNITAVVVKVESGIVKKTGMKSRLSNGRSKTKTVRLIPNLLYALLLALTAVCGVVAALSYLKSLV